MKKKTLWCVIGFCGRRADRAHIRTRGAGATWEEWEWIPLCRKHHIEQGQLGWAEFCARHHEPALELAARGWVFETIFGIIKLKREGEI